MDELTFCGFSNIDISNQIVVIGSQSIACGISRANQAISVYRGETLILDCTMPSTGLAQFPTVVAAEPTLHDESFDGFGSEETYTIVVGTESPIAGFVDNGILTSFDMNDIWCIVPMDGSVVADDWAGPHTNFSVSQKKTTVKKRYDIKLLPEDLLPKTVAKNADVQKAQRKSQSAADTAQRTANTAQRAADTAQRTADNAESAADNAKSAADAAQRTANTAKSTADTAKSTANTAKSAADNANSTAWSAFETAGNAKNRVIDLESRVLTDEGAIRQAQSTANNALDRAISVQDIANNATTTASYAANVAANAIRMGVTNATVGQIIKVKTVDVNGNPTAWEPTDMPEYELPVATSEALGGVKPVAKTSAMSQDVGVDDNGKLYTIPGETLPKVTTSDNGKFMRVVNGAWTAAEIQNANGEEF